MNNEKGVALLFALALLMIVTLTFSSYVSWYERQYRQYDSLQLVYQKMANDILNKEYAEELIDFE